jgi:hypothetical protein
LKSIARSFSQRYKSEEPVSKSLGSGTPGKVDPKNLRWHCGLDPDPGVEVLLTTFDKSEQQDGP